MRSKTDKSKIPGRNLQGHFRPPWASNQKTKLIVGIPTRSATKPLRRAFNRSTSPGPPYAVISRRAGVINNDHFFSFFVCNVGGSLRSWMETVIASRRFTNCSQEAHLTLFEGW